MTTPARCSTSSSRRNGSRRRPRSASGRPMPTATISPSMPTTAARRRSRPSTRCASSSRSAKAASIRRCRISSRRPRAACRTISAPSWSPPGSARTWSPTASRTPMTIIPRSCARRWRTVSRKPLPSGCTARAPRILGLCAGRGDVAGSAHPRTVPGHPPGAGLSRAARSHREGDAVRAARCREERRRDS